MVDAAAIEGAARAAVTAMTSGVRILITPGNTPILR
jgi:hypothetical protein